MNEKDILKALECCSEAEFKEDCEKLKCPFFDNETYNCINVDDENAMHRYSLNLIKRQQAEIKRLNTNMDSMVAEHSRLIATAKSEAIKEFAERLKSKCRDSIELDDYRMTVVTKLDIDDLVEGMAGGEDSA